MLAIMPKEAYTATPYSLRDSAAVSYYEGAANSQ
jgi:hypothetical protein